MKQHNLVNLTKKGSRPYPCKPDIKSVMSSLKALRAKKKAKEDLDDENSANEEEVNKSPSPAKVRLAFQFQRSRGVCLALYWYNFYPDRSLGILLEPCTV